jgi:hypothetical protein
MATQFGQLFFVEFNNKLVINDDELSEFCLERGNGFIEMNFFGSLGTIWRPKDENETVFDCEIFLERDSQSRSIARFDRVLDKWLITDKWGIRRQFSWLKMEHLGLKDGDKLQLINLNED